MMRICARVSRSCASAFSSPFFWQAFMVASMSCCAWSHSPRMMCVCPAMNWACAISSSSPILLLRVCSSLIVASTLFQTGVILPSFQQPPSLHPARNFARALRASIENSSVSSPSCCSSSWPRRVRLTASSRASPAMQIWTNMKIASASPRRPPMRAKMSWASLPMHSAFFRSPRIACMLQRLRKAVASARRFLHLLSRSRAILPLANASAWSFRPSFALLCAIRYCALSSSSPSSSEIFTASAIALSASVKRSSSVWMRPTAYSTRASSLRAAGD
mmetsp:Transcript_2583/g.6638  ORF Transcript_2583/g.6638 Transcript_2583/m.6638 type:complete len:276 (+) Transcript_2583:775-1602(+)